MHTTRCNHATGTMEEYVEQAIARGIGEIGFSEHMPVMPEPRLAMSYAQLPGYLDEVKQLQDRYADRIVIRLGAEMDIANERADEIREIISRSGFDYVIGSIHYLDDWPFDQEPYRDRFSTSSLEDLYGHFFDTVIAAAESGLYDIAGHIDNLKRMGWPPPNDLTSYYHRLAAAFKTGDVTVELNTSGWDHPIGEPYPSPALLCVLAGHGVPVTTGSDAHAPEQVGRHFDRAAVLLDTAGYSHISRFENRRRTETPIGTPDA